MGWGVCVHTGTGEQNWYYYVEMFLSMSQIVYAVLLPFYTTSCKAGDHEVLAFDVPTDLITATSLLFMTCVFPPAGGQGDAEYLEPHPNTCNTTHPMTIDVPLLYMYYT